MSQKNNNALIEQDENQLTVTRANAPAIQAASLASIADNLALLSHWVTSGALEALLSGCARAGAVKEMLGGLAAHEGRKALDGRVLEQNAVEIVTQVEAVFKKYRDSLQSTEKKDSKLHDAESDYQAWREMKKNEDGN